MAASRAIGVAALLLSVGLGACRQLQDSLLYYPAAGPATPPLPPQGWSVEPLALLRPDGAELRGWLVKPPAAPAALLAYFGGNGEEVSWQVPIADRFGGRAVALVNYRGYGESTGRPSEAALTADAVALVDALATRSDVDGARMALMGRSLGSGVATYVASRRAVDRVVLVSPFDSVAAVAAKHFPAALVRLVLSDRYDAASLAAGIRVPLLAIVAGRDDIVPVANSRSLYERWGGEKRWLELPRAGHNDLQDDARFWEAIGEFLASGAVR